MRQGIKQMLSPYDVVIGAEHVKETPDRVVRMFDTFIHNLTVDPRECLKTFEEANYDEMITVSAIPFTSLCAHHLLPFFGTVHFSYVPSGRVVGLSKIARFVRASSHRPHIQEALTGELARQFQATVTPKGTAVCIDAYHSCMFARGVEIAAPTRTTALLGCYRDQAVRAEFFQGLPSIPAGGLPK